MAKLDFNRGAIIRVHPSGMKVAQYVDEPGVYYDETNNVVSQAVAHRAGFDVESDGKARVKQQRLAEFKAQLEKEFADTEDRLMALAEDGGDEAVVKNVGSGQWAIYDKAGNRVTKHHLNEEEARLLLSQIQGGEVAAAAKDAPQYTSDDVKKAEKATAKKAGSTAKGKASASKSDGGSDESDLV